jgi:hypothetical protein
VLSCKGQEARGSWDAGSQDFLSRFAEGTVLQEELQEAAKRMRQFVGTLTAFTNSIDAAARRMIQFAADASAVALLTNVPWEIMPVADNGLSHPADDPTAGTLAGLAVARVVQGAPVLEPPPTRLRAALCISNPASYPSLRSFYPAPYVKMLRGLLSHFPLIDAYEIDGGSEGPHSGLVLAQIRARRPHILIFVGHGVTDAGGATLMFEDRRLPVAELADALGAGKGRTALVVLLACDQARSNPITASGALTLVQGAVPAVVAMQGRVSQVCARVFLQEFLNQLLVGVSVPEAAAAGRRAASRERNPVPHCFYPAVFLGEAHAGSGAVLKRVLDPYDADLRGLWGHLPRAPADALERKDLDDQCREALARTGLVLVRGEYGSGRTSLLARALDAIAPGNGRVPSRPVFYVDCESAVSSGPPSVTAFARLRELMAKARRLLPENVPSGLGAANAADLFNDCRSILILDNLDLGEETEREQEFWRAFLAGATNLRKSLVVAVTDLEVPGAAELKVPAFNEAQTRGYLEAVLPGLVKRAAEVHRTTRGLPLFLRALRSAGAGAANEALREAAETTGRAGPLDRYVNALPYLLSPEALVAVCRLAWLPRMTKRAAAVRFFTDEDEEVLNELVRGGAATEWAEGGQHWIGQPRAKAAALRRRLREEVATAAELLVLRFRTLMLPELEPNIAQLARTQGGAAVLLAIQSAAAATGSLDLVLAVAQLGDVAEGESSAWEDAWALYEAALRDAPALIQDEDRVRAAEVAQGALRSDRAGKLLEYLDGRAARLSTFVNARRLLALATHLKDARQHEAADEILGHLDGAVAIAEVARDKPRGTGANRAEWTGLLASLLQKRVDTRLFLGKADVKDVAGDVERLKGLTRGSASYANLLCTLAERAMKASTLTAEGCDQVAGWLLEAQEIVDKLHDPDLKTYQRYQYGQYLRKSPTPQLAAAEEQYKEADEAARDARNPVRQGLARYRWVDLAVHSLKTLGGPEGCARLDDVIPEVEGYLHTALGARTAERLHTLWGEVSRSANRDLTEPHLEGACRASAQPPLTGEGDRPRCGRAFRRFLERLREIDDFARAQQFVQRYRDVFAKRLGIAVRIADPWTALTELRNRYPDKQEADG